MILRSIMKNDVWLTELGSHDLDLSPADTAEAGTERLRHCFFGRKARGEAVHATGAERDLRGRESALEKPITRDIDGALKLLELYSINARPNDPGYAAVRRYDLAPGEGVARSTHGLTRAK